MELLAIRLGGPLSTVSWSCSEQLKTLSSLAGGVAFVPFVTHWASRWQQALCTNITAPEVSTCSHAPLDWPAPDSTPPPVTPPGLSSSSIPLCRVSPGTWGKYIFLRQQVPANMQQSVTCSMSMKLCIVMDDEEQEYLEWEARPLRVRSVRL